MVGVVLVAGKHCKYPDSGRCIFILKTRKLFFLNEGLG